MTNNKQTAVEWLVGQLQQTRDWQRVINEANQSSTSVINVIEQAKEMEKQQIMKAYNEDTWWVQQKNKKFNNAEDYYEEIYGGCK
jgi:hypothetical protein